MVQLISLCLLISSITNYIKACSVLHFLYSFRFQILPLENASSFHVCLWIILQKSATERSGFRWRRGDLLSGMHFLEFSHSELLDTVIRVSKISSWFCVFCVSFVFTCRGSIPSLYKRINTYTEKNSLFSVFLSLLV